MSDTNRRPSDIVLTPGALRENSLRTTAGILSVLDPDAGDTHTFTLSDSRFELFNDSIRLQRGIRLDYETEPTITFNVTATDSGGRSRTETFTLNVTHVNEVPSDIVLTGDEVREGVQGAVVGTLDTFDPDAGDNPAYSVSDTRFEVVGDRLKLRDNVALQLDDDGLVVDVTATDEGGLTRTESFTVTVIDADARPVLLTPARVAENLRRVTIGELSVAGAGPGEDFTFSVTDRRFAVDGTALKIVSNFFDFETTPTLTVQVTVTEADADTFTRDVVVTVLDVNEAPVFTSGPAFITIREGFTDIARYGAADVDAGTTLTYSIVGGFDASRFVIDSATGALAFATAPDFESRQDNNRDNTYNVGIGVSDGTLTAVREVDVTIADVFEPGTNTLFKRRIDFAPEGSEIAPGFLADTGQAYNAADGYGWVTEASVADGTANGTIPDAIFPYGNDVVGAVNERDDPTGLIEARLRTYAHFEFPNAPPTSAQHWAWEHAVKNATYVVRVAIGDTGGMNDSVNVLNIEGRNVIAGFVPTNDLKTILVTTIVTVTDGRLTLDSIGGTNTEIQSIRFEELRNQTPADGRPVQADYSFFREAVAVIGGEEPIELAQARGINPDAAFSIGIGGADSDDLINTNTIDTTSVKLVETLTGEFVTGTVNTDATGGTITFQPTQPLKANTTYTLVIDGVRTLSGEELIPSTSTFATGEDLDGPPTEIAFARQEMDVAATTPYSSIVISPDGVYLYATTLAGSIVRWEIDADTGVLGSEQVLALPALEGRALIGIVFDPENPNLLWITNNDPLASTEAAEFTGKISRVTIGAGNAFTGTVEDYVVGLPRSIRDHLSNSLAFHQETPGGDWKLYMTQGSNSATGAPDDSWGNRPERLLSAAVLEIDPRRDVSGGPIDVQTQDPDTILPPGAGAQVGWYNPLAANAPVKLYATGVRNAYDLVWHSNGHLYVPTNGSAASGNTPDDPSTTVDESLTGVGAQNDYLFDVEDGFYYGHPNPIRGEFILNAGNPTIGDDGPGEVAPDTRYPGYPVGVTPPLNYGGFAYNFSQGRSPNGAVEYLANAFGGTLKNALLVVEYSGGKDIVALRFDGQGNVIDDDTQPFTLADAAGNRLTFANPLDLATDSSGRIYIVQLGEDGAAVTLLTPTAPDVAPPPGQVLEAEDAVLTGSRIAVATNQGNYEATGFVDFRDNTDESITWTFDVRQAGIYTITFRYSLPDTERNADGRPLELTVNGDAEGVLPFLPNARTFSEWGLTDQQDVMLQVGSNTINLTSIGRSGANIDQLLISAEPVTAINTPPTISGSQDDLSFAAGQPVSFVLDGIDRGDVDPGDAATLVARLVGGAPLPGWLDFDPGTNQFSSNLSEVPAPGVYEIEIVAFDQQDESRGLVKFAIEIVRQLDPADVDGDGTLNAADNDDDGDGVADIRDPFAADPSNGQATAITEGRKLVFDFSDRPFGADPGYVLGITGLHLSGSRTPEQLGLGSPNLTIGGGVLHIENAGVGDLATDNLTLGAQFGIDPIARLIRISATFDHPFDTRAPARGANFGLLIGTGDADDYVKFVLEGKDANGAFLQMETRDSGVRIDGDSPSFGRTTPLLYRQADANDRVTFTFDLNTDAGTLTASWLIRNGAEQISGSAPTITLSGDLLRAVQGDYTVLTNGGVAVDSGLSVGIVASSRNTTPPLDIDVLDITVEGFVTDPEITLVGDGGPLLGSRGVFNFIRDPSENTGPPGANPPREYKDVSVITVRNDGDDVLNVMQVDLDGPFRFVNADDEVPFSLQAGQTRNIEVAFDGRPQVYDPEVDPEVFSGELRIVSDDEDEPVSVAELAGFYQTVAEGGQEPNFNELMQVFGLGTRADLDKLDNFDLYERAGPDEVLSPYWQIANGYDAVTVTQLAAFHDISNAAIFIYEPNNGEKELSQSILTQDSLYNQSILPLTTGGVSPTQTFDVVAIPDAWTGADVFGFRVAGQFSDPALNPDGPGNDAPQGQRGHFIRFFVAKDEAGNAIDDTYVIAQDYQGINYDYQDNLYLVQGIRAANEALFS